MEQDIIVYYSKQHKFKWFVALAILSAIYLGIFLFLNIQVYAEIHFIFLFYLILFVVSLTRPYLLIKNNKISSSNYLFKSLKLDELSEVSVSNTNYIFKENHKYLFIDLDLVSAKDKRMIIAFLKKRKLLEYDDDCLNNLTAVD